MARSARDPSRKDAREARSRFADWLVWVGVRMLALCATGLVIAYAVVRPQLESGVELHRNTPLPQWYSTAVGTVQTCGVIGLILLLAGLTGRMFNARGGSRPSRTKYPVAYAALSGADEVEGHGATGRTGSKRPRRKQRAAAAFVPVSYPVALGVVSFGWAVVGWLLAALAPRLAFLPGANVLHLLFPAVTVVLLGVNLYVAARSLLRGAHAMRLLVVTGVEVALFTTLFFQLYAHVGAELYDAPGPTTPWQWLQFSAAHALRAGDVLDAIEAYGLAVQPVKHVSPLVAGVVVTYHVIVDVFFLGLVWAAVGRVRGRLLADTKFRGLTTGVALAGCGVWFVAWVAFAFFVRPWRAADMQLWFAENALRVIDVADVMESFDIRLHTLPREGVVGTLTLLCRLWFALGLMVLVTRKRAPAARRVLTPPGAAAGRFWSGRFGMLAGMAAVFVAAGLGGMLLAGRPEEALVAAVRDGPDDRAADALLALRRMGPAARDAVPQLMAVRADAPPAVRDGITRTLGYLGPPAATALRDIALGVDPRSAELAVDALAAGGGRNAPDIVTVWARHPSEDVRGRAEAALRRLGSAATGPLTDGMTAANSHDHYVWLQNLDPNWRLRDTANPIARNCQSLPDLMRRARGAGTPEEAAA
ncbi:MAG TPA: hypothetical protein VD866_21130, partial [Urbifossiella sp.]|nr:hypothetical protein [Urbifossiella sp.]